MLRQICRPSSIFEYEPGNEALNLRNQAKGMPLGVRRSELMRRAERIGNTAAIKERRMSVRQQPRDRRRFTRGSAIANAAITS
jgi:hypothetical protein